MTSGMKIDWENFTPFQSLAGGVLIGASTSIYLLTSGRIAGISGLLDAATSGWGSKQSKDFPLKLAFTAGISLVGAVSVLAGLFQPTTSMESAFNLVLGGLMVGAGAKLQHGCTSGHGVCGLSRKSPKSLALVSSFMITGALTVGFVRPLLTVPQPQSSEAGVLATLPLSIVSNVIPYVSVLALCYSLYDGTKNLAAPIIGALTGGLFGVGLILGGMADPKKVVGFLDITSVWDPSLAFVMGGAVLVAILPFQWAQQQGRNDASEKVKSTVFLFPKEKFSHLKYLEPKSWSEHTSKAKSLAGSILFGAGWAITGMCPGPGLVLGGAGNSAALLYLPAVVLGQKIVGALFS